MERRQNLRDQFFIDSEVDANLFDEDLNNINFDNLLGENNSSAVDSSNQPLDVFSITNNSNDCFEDYEHHFAEEISDVCAYEPHHLSFEDIDVPASTTNYNSEAVFNEIASNINQSGTGNIINFSRIGDTSHEYNKYFKKHEFVSEYRVSHSLRTRADLFKFEREIDLFFHSLILEYINNSEYRRRNDMISVEIFEPSMRNRLYVPPFRINSFNLENFLNTLMVLSQSNTEFLLTGTFQLIVRVVENVIGGANKRKAPEDVSVRNKKKRSIIEIITRQSDAGSCGFRALYVGKYLADNGKNNAREWQRVLKDYMEFQTNGAKEIANLCGFDWKRRLDILDFNVIQEKMPDYQIRMIDSLTREILFAGPVRDKEITVIHSDVGVGHYDYCSSITAFLEKRYFCRYCNTATEHRVTHHCDDTCEQCFHQPKCDTGIQQVECSDCRRMFYGQHCYQNHMENVCKKKKKCSRCEVEYTGKHDCNKHKCSKCGDEFERFPHYCFLKTLNMNKIREEDNTHKIIVVYDVETVQYRQNNMLKHKANLVVSTCVCSECYNYETKEKNVDDCRQCGKTYTPFHGDNCVKHFCDYVYKVVAATAALKKGMVILFAHNSRGFDGHFILKDMFARQFTQQPEIIMTGNKILKIEIGNCKFIDSLSFFQMPLDALPKAFGLSSIKGHFPHSFNKEENYNYNGPLPDLHEYGIDYLLPKKAEELRVWHREESQRLQDTNSTFIFKDELVKYCITDVMVLMQAVMQFSKLLKEMSDIDPFTRCFTLASLALEVFRAKFLKEKSIGITPLNGYKYSKNASKAGTAWLLATEKIEQEIDPTFAICREQKMGKHFVDGICYEKRIIYEYDGCYFHGCETCYENRMDQLGGNRQTHAENLNKTRERDQYLQTFHYHLVKSSDCKLKEALRTNAKLKRYYTFFYKRLSEIQKVGDVEVEVRGGRTQNICFYYRAQEGEEIKYFDFTSLYPYVCAKKQLPLGHPTQILPDHNDITSYYGFIKCAIIPPRQLHIPVLPNKIRNKLLFPLCPVCAREKIQTSCPHSDEERTITDTFYSVELNRAIRKGYKIKQVYAVNNYTRSATDVFEEYVNLFLKIKQEASGFPNHVVTQEQKERYCEYYRENTNISLDIEKITSNPALRTLAKLLLNTIWGKFAQQTNKTKTKLCTQYSDYWNILNDTSKHIIGEAEVAERLMLIKYKDKEAEDCASRKSNFALAAAVTGNARDCLYEEIDKIESERKGRVLYMDTDSIIFTKRQNEYEPILGDFMGQMTDEISKDYGVGSKIVEFVSNGPKNYGYRVLLPSGESKYCLKVKGIRINTAAADLLTFERMVTVANAYMNGEEVVTRIPQFNIGTDLHQNVYTNYFEKIYRAVTDKRRIEQSSVFTKPYGYTDN